MTIQEDNFEDCPNHVRFERACQLLHDGHAKGRPTPADAVNGLFRKHLTGRGYMGDLPWLTSNNVIVTLERKSKPYLRSLAPRDQSRRPRHTEFPVVIVRFRGQEYLIDGGSRAHQWYVLGETDEHLAYLLTVSE